MRPRVLAAAGALLCAACAPSERPTAPQPPKIVLQEQAYDFGRAEQGTMITHRFTVRNGGGWDLKIDNVRTSCGCTAALPSTRVIPPGGEGVIEASLDTVQEFGRKTATISVYSSDPAQPVSTLTLTGEVHADVAAAPPRLYVGRVRRGQAVKNEVRLVGDGAAALDVVSIESDGKVIDATVRAGDTGRWLDFSVRPDAPLGAFHESVTVRTNSRRRPRLSIPLSGRVEGDVVVSPTHLDFGVSAVGTPPSRALAVRNLGTGTVHVTGATLSPPVGEARVTPLRDGHEYRIAVALHDAVAAGRVQGTLQVQTDHPEQRLIAVPFSGRVLEKK